MNCDLPDTDMPFFAEASRKRKSLDLEGNSFHDASYRGDFDDSFQHLPSRGFALNLPVSTPVLRDSHWRTPQTTTQFESNSLLAPGILQKNHLINEETGCSLTSSTFQKLGPFSNVNSFSQDVFLSSSSRHSLHDIKTQNEPAQLQSYMGMGYNDHSVSCVDRSHLFHKSYAGMNIKGDYNDIPFKQCQGSMTYQHKPCVEPCGQVFVNDHPESRQRNITREIYIEPFKVQKGEQGLYFPNCMGISQSSTSVMKTSFGAGEKDVSVMHQNLSINVRAGSECSQSNLGDAEKNTKSMLQMLEPAVSSNFEVICSQDKGLKDITMDITCSETKIVGVSNDSQTDNRIQSVMTGNLVKLTNDSLLDEEIKVDVTRTSSIVPDKLWDGSLQLSNSIIVSATAFFKRVAAAEKGTGTF